MAYGNVFFLSISSTYRRLSAISLLLSPIIITKMTIRPSTIGEMLLAASAKKQLIVSRNLNGEYTVSESLKAICVEALMEWHSRKDGNTFTSLAEKLGIADSTIRSIAKGSVTPTFYTGFKILSAIWPMEKVADTLQLMLNSNGIQVMVKSGINVISIHLTTQQEGWLALNIAADESLDLAFVIANLGPNAEPILNKFIESGLIRIENDKVLLNSQHSVVPDTASVKIMGSVVADRSNPDYRENDFYSVRAGAFTKDAIQEISEILREANSRIAKVMLADTSKGDNRFAVTLISAEF
ncbi:MAG: hypothetical protein M3Q07_05720 [Pseudobdellovibrionaceae bacterium]|nr:hypothetical protein [Pseudobdellovibrionaceae bacterium]